MWICKKCGKNMAEDLTTCSYCGAERNAQVPEKKQTLKFDALYETCNEYDALNNLSSMIVGVICLLIIAAVFVFFIAVNEEMGVFGVVGVGGLLLLAVPFYIVYVYIKAQASVVQNLFTIRQAIIWMVENNEKKEV